MYLKIEVTSIQESSYFFFHSFTVCLALFTCTFLCLLWVARSVFWAHYCTSLLFFFSSDFNEKDLMNHLHALLKAFLLESVLEGTWGWVWIFKLLLLLWTFLELFLLHTCFFALDDLTFNSKRFFKEKSELFQQSYVLYFKLSKVNFKFCLWSIWGT